VGALTGASIKDHRCTATGVREHFSADRECRLDEKRNELSYGGSVTGMSGA
jgi:hypothetical protein